MTTMAWAFAALTTLFALTDWWAVVTDRRTVRYFAKPATLAALVAVAVAMDPVDPAIGTVMVVGLVLSLAGDVFLMLPEKWFVAGLASFLLAHVAYVVALQMADRSVPGTLVGLALVTLAVVLVGRHVVATLRRGGHPEMVGPVIAYVVVISAMVVSAWGTLNPWAIVGATLFYCSDGILAWNRFVKPLPHGNLAVMTTYHLGQAGLVAWLVTG